MNRFTLPLVLVLGVAACADHTPPLAPADVGALPAQHGQGPQNPEVEIFEVDQEEILQGMCVGYPGFADGLDIHQRIQGQIRVTWLRHPVSGALRVRVVSQGVTVVYSANGRSASGRSARMEVSEFDLDGNVTRDVYVGLNLAVTAPGWGVILLDAGRLVFDWATETFIFEAGPHQGWKGDFGRLCEYFTW